LVALARLDNTVLAAVGRAAHSMRVAFSCMGGLAALKKHRAMEREQFGQPWAGVEGKRC